MISAVLFEKLLQAFTKLDLLTTSTLKRIMIIVINIEGESNKTFSKLKIKNYINLTVTIEKLYCSHYTMSMLE